MNTDGGRQNATPKKNPINVIWSQKQVLFSGVKGWRGTGGFIWSSFDLTSHSSERCSSSVSSWAQHHSAELSSPDVNIPPPWPTKLLPHLRRQIKRKIKQNTKHSPWSWWLQEPHKIFNETITTFLKLTLFSVYTPRECVPPPLTIFTAFSISPGRLSWFLSVFQSQVSLCKDVISKILLLNRIKVLWFIRNIEEQTDAPKVPGCTCPSSSSVSFWITDEGSVTRHL